MITQGNKQAKTARQLTATDSPHAGENYVHNVNKNWADELINLYDSVDEYGNRDNAIINKLGEVRGERAALELKFLLDHVGNDVRKEFLRKFFVNDASNDASCTKVELRWVGYTDVKLKNSGPIRLYLNKNGSKEMVYFKRRPSFILYLIYLLEAYDSENVTSLDITERDQRFRKLFDTVYAYDGGMEYFKTLMGKGNSEQKLLRHCLGDIRKTIGATCELLEENASPYILKNKHWHLNIEKKNILIDEKFLMKLSI